MNVDSLNQKYMYKHKANIYREEIVVLEDLSKKTRLEKVAENIPCKLSIKNIDKPEQGSISALTEAFKLFTAPSSDIRRGDVVEISGNRYTAAEPLNYPHHKEIMLARSEI